MTVIVFLHIPKTAGQTVHNALVRAVGADAVSPIRVHTQAAPAGQFPPGYRLYSGHLDWTELDSLPAPRFVFSILRDPRERIASFYFYLRKEAEALDRAALDRPENLGKKRALSWTAEDYFFGGDPAWQDFIRDHYDNFYCSYFATRRMRGRAEIAGLAEQERLDRAVAGAGSLDGLYTIADLAPLEADLSRLLSRPVSFAGTHANRGPLSPGTPRWPELVALLGSDRLARRLDGFATLDSQLLDRLLRADRPPAP